jgi:hypothetical protein
MGFYQNQIVPILTYLAMRQRDLAAYRSRVSQGAQRRRSRNATAGDFNGCFWATLKTVRWVRAGFAN